MTSPWEFADQHLKQMRDDLIQDRAESVAHAEREAAEASARGDEQWSALWRTRAGELRAYRFHWEVEAEAAA